MLRSFVGTVSKPSPTRILLVRPDRIGDVLLSTPAVEALRRALPEAFLVMLVAPEARDIVDGNPYLNTFLILDKKGEHRGLFGMIRLIRMLREFRFDTAVVFHGTRRIHLALWLARVPERVGYDRKWGFLLTKRFKDVKVFGKKHESDYTLDLIRSLGLPVSGGKVTMPTTVESDLRMDRFLKEQGVTKGDRLVAIHPGASCPSKRWPAERFAEVADRLLEKNYKVVLIAGPQDIATGRAVVQKMKRPLIDASGKTSIRELGSLLKRMDVLVSNDSGPVHVAAGVGTPVVAIFGRSQPGLSQTRWRPLGKAHIVLQKDVGCIVCLAHNCQIHFECLQALSVKEVLEAAEQILEKKQ